MAGRYRYTGRDAWIELVGEAFGKDALHLEEKVGDSIAGQFYLENEGQGPEGFWVDEATDLKVQLAPVRGVVDELLDPMPLLDVSARPTGQYRVGHYWVNDLFAPHYEIGFNGGEVNVVEVRPNIILVGFEFFVGPTYHIASFLGHATLTEEGAYVHDAVLPGEDLKCRLVFRFDGTQLSIEDDENGYACQFGARAHADFDLHKISDIAEFRSPR